MSVIQDVETEEELPLTLTASPTKDIINFQASELSNAPWARLEPTDVYLRVIDLKQPIFTLGRSPECDVCLTEGNFYPDIPDSFQMVSKFHCSITYDEKTEVGYINDNSKNGTFVNKVPVLHRRGLQHNDIIALGWSNLKVFVYKRFNNDINSYLPKPLFRKYVLSVLIGTGASGEVRLLINQVDLKKYAVKKIDKCTTSNSSRRLNSTTQIKNEISILHNLKHPNVISIIEMEETMNCVFIVLEHMEGSDLDKFIKAKGSFLTENQIKVMFYQIALGVQYLHSKNITHRDLKPGNILLKSTDAETLIKISDFGLSKIINSTTVMNTVCGTPLFVAPEIINMLYEDYTNKVDIWSLGVILYFMLSKELPFIGNTPKEIWRLIRLGRYTMEGEIWDAISFSAKDLVCKMLVVDPEQRLTIDEVINHLWVSDDRSMHLKVQRLINDNGN